MGELDHSPLAFLGALTDEERAAFHAAGRERRYSRGEAIFHEGDDPGGVIAILGGRAKVSASGVGGREVVLRFAGEGELLGELSAIAGRPRTATITALDALETGAPRTRVASAPRAAPARIAGCLLELAETSGEPAPGGVRITLPLSQDELGAWAGASREAVARSLHLLRELGWIETRRREIRVLNADGLRGLI